MHVLATSIYFAYVYLQDSIVKLLRHQTSFSHSAINLVNVSDIEAQTCIGKPIKQLLKLTACSAYRLSFVHILETDGATKRFPTILIEDCIRMQNDGPTTFGTCCSAATISGSCSEVNRLGAWKDTYRNCRRSKLFRSSMRGRSSGRRNADSSTEFTGIFESSDSARLKSPNATAPVEKPIRFIQNTPYSRVSSVSL